MKTRILKFLVVSLVIFGVIFSNVPYYLFSSAIDSYINTRNIVDKLWLAQNENDPNVVDNFSSLRNLPEELRIHEAMAATSFINVAHYNAASQTTPFNAVVNKPTNTANNDIMFTLIMRNNNGAVDSVPTGWTLLAQHQYSTTYHQMLYWKLASGEGASYTWSFASSGSTAITVATFRGGFNTANPIDTYSNTEYITSNTTVRAASMNVSAAGSVLLNFASFYSSNTTRNFTKPSVPTTDWVEHNDYWITASDFARTIDSMTWTGSGATGNIDTTCSTTGTTVKHAFAVALNPAPVVPGIASSLGKTTDGWAGAVPVYGTLTGGLTYANYPYARAQVTTIAGQGFSTPMTWNAGNSRFEGVIYPGSNICMGCDDPKTYNGSFSVVVQLDNNAGFPSIDYTSSASTFTIVMTVKRTSMDAVQNPANYTDFNSIWSTDHWHTTISDFGFGMKSGTGTNIAVAVPIHPITSSPTNFAITVNGASVSPGSAQSTGVNAWWWETSSHTLYIQFASLPQMATTGTVSTDVDIAFDTDTDLFATRYNWTQTFDMGQRWGSNGLYIANQYLSTFIYPKPTSTTDNNLACSSINECEQAGLQAESRAHPVGGGADQSTDCMERVAVHVDDIIRADTSGSANPYQHDIKWSPNENASWITAESNTGFTIVQHSDNTAVSGVVGGWAQQLDNGITATRTQNYYSGKRYIKNTYDFYNGGSSTHKYPMVWEREQWHGTDRAANDAGRFANDPSNDVIMEQRVSPSGWSKFWQTAYDKVTFINMGMIWDKNNLPDYQIFAVEAFLGRTTAPYAEWPIQITASHGTQTADQTGFEKTWSSVAPGQTVSFTFWHVHNAETSWANIESAMNADNDELNPSGGSLTADIVNASYAPVANPSMAMSSTNFNFSCQNVTGSFGSSSEQIYVNNTGVAGGWTLTLAAQAPTDYWNGGTVNYDFNDSTSAGCADGGDTDSLGGQMTIDPSVATLAVGGCSGCTTANISKGGAAAFSEGVTNNITLLSASAAANNVGDWTLRDVAISQKIPAEQPVGSYSVNMVLSITAN